MEDHVQLAQLSRDVIAELLDPERRLDIHNDGKHEFWKVWQHFLTVLDESERRRLMRPPSESPVLEKSEKYLQCSFPRII